MEDHRLEVAHVLRRAVEAGEALLLEDRLERVARRGPHALGLVEAELVERRANGDDQLALERVLRRRDRVGLALAEVSIGGLSLGERGRDVGGGGGGGSGLGANRHCAFVEDGTSVSARISLASRPIKKSYSGPSSFK